MQAKIYRRLKMKEACRSGTPLFCGGYLSEYDFDCTCAGSDDVDACACRYLGMA